MVVVRAELLVALSRISSIDSSYSRTAMPLNFSSRPSSSGGGQFLADHAVHISASKTHSLSWLAQFVFKMTALNGKRLNARALRTSRIAKRLLTTSILSIPARAASFKPPKQRNRVRSTFLSSHGGWTHCWGFWIRLLMHWRRRGTCGLRRYQNRRSSRGGGDLKPTIH